MRHHRTAVLFSAVVAIIPVMAGGPGAAADPEPTELEHAIHFRESTGLRAGKEFVLSTYDDPKAYPSERWGIPISREEGADLDARLVIQSSVGDAYQYASTRDDFAGAYLDQLRHARPVFMFTESPNRFDEAIANRLPKGGEFDTRTADHSWTYLLSTSMWCESESTRFAIEWSSVCTTSPTQRHPG
jgi:hypothetical protein